MPIEKLTRAHGHTDSAHCSSCKKEFDIEVIKKHMKDGVAAYCECGKPAKPDIVFFGE